MQLKRLYIKDYKILKDFTIEFPFDSNKYISIFIGANGSGKSTILEAIAQIFSDTLLNKKAKFNFKLEYTLRLFDESSSTPNFFVQIIHIKLIANKNDKIKIFIDNKNVSEEKTKEIIINKRGNKIKKSIIPDNIVMYYSGFSEILKDICYPHIKKNSKEYRQGNISTKNVFFYFEPIHFEITLLSLLSFEFGEIPEFLESKANINGVQSIQIHLKKPNWGTDSIQNFWGAKGEVRNFLEYLNENCASVEDLQNPDHSDRIGNIVIEAWQDEALIITIISQQKLFEIREYLIEEKKLFEILNIMYYDGLLENINFSLTNNNKQSFNILSEGEQQLIIIKGLTEFLSKENTLFLFDEPDTYLHPKWQRQYISSLEKATENSIESENFFIIATHSPQLLSNAKTEKNFVKIIEKGKLIEKTPRFYGREINTILYELMDVEERNEFVKNLISHLFTLIEEEEIKDAEKSLQELQELIGDDDPELLRASIQLEYLKEDE